MIQATPHSSIQLSPGLRVCLFGLQLLKSSCEKAAVEKQLQESAGGILDLMFGKNAFDGCSCWF
jgi:hypothetical protein